jgi:hypothetical protein
VLIVTARDRPALGDGIREQVARRHRTGAAVDGFPRWSGPTRGRPCAGVSPPSRACARTGKATALARPRAPIDRVAERNRLSHVSSTLRRVIIAIGAVLLGASLVVGFVVYQLQAWSQDNRLRDAEEFRAARQAVYAALAERPSMEGTFKRLLGPPLQLKAARIGSSVVVTVDEWDHLLRDDLDRLHVPVRVEYYIDNFGQRTTEPRVGGAETEGRVTIVLVDADGDGEPDFYRSPAGRVDSDRWTPSDGFAPMGVPETAGLHSYWEIALERLAEIVPANSRR